MNAGASHIVVMGGGHAGGAAVAFLRQFGWKDPITLVCAESALPYQRPPLSKAWLNGEISEKDLLLRPAKFYSDHAIAIRPNVAAVAVDPGQQTVRLGCGASLQYSHLIAATGAHPLAMPGTEGLTGVLLLRTIADAEKIRLAMRAGSNLVVIGGGFVGLEVAATARSLGMSVTIVEREPHLLSRVASRTLAAFVEGFFRRNQVRLELGCTVDSFASDEGRVTGVRLSNGAQLNADAVVVGIGARPNDAILREAGIRCESGVIVDDCARTSHDAIFAIGDCTNRPLPQLGIRARLESVPSALEQARQAASTICGRPAPKPEVPWFWSDQFDLRIQIAGLRHGTTETIVRGEVESARFAVFHLGEGDVVRAVEAVNAAPEFMMGKTLIAQQRPVSREKLSNMAVAIRDVAI
ncbi:FAD-dependent oxidoreductase [Bradyrhizobium sp. LHD-71]|uniref:NAD(P)/FAD-dependent oxidoreductase n=1 Tax=Bradyrhizobium sp. LHD-71 TaxID=3072141 RepID=UPI00280E79BC|nr:FAD-dependent oxidoreductase [Bradyrhizobium sp. LHD-71]MDQ8726230.1 FAD-dependent oxidoreductase [Bradyrhizobium sp. LHD-71]